MKYYKRAFISITRNLSKSILLFLVVFLLGNLIVSTVCIQNTTNNVKEQIKNKLGASITINGNDEMLEKYMSNIYQYSLEKNVVKIVENVCEKNDSVKLCECLVNKSGYSDDFTMSTNNIMNTESKEYREFNQLIGVDNSNFVDIYDHNIIITKGRTFTEDEIDQGMNVILLNEDYQRVDDVIIDESNDELKITRETSNLEIGDIITVSYPIYNETYGETFTEIKEEYEIIGFLKKNRLQSNNVFGAFSYDYSDAIYIPNNSMNKTNEKINKIVNDNSLGYEYEKYLPQLLSITLKLDDPDQLNFVSNELKTNLIKNTHYYIDVYSSADSFDVVVGPLESLKNISQIVLILTVAISLFVLYLVITLFLKDRKYEIGIYISLGENKKKVLTQIFLEVFVIGIFAISLSLFSGKELGNKFSNIILESQIKNQEELISVKLKNLESVNPEDLDVSIIQEEYSIELLNETIILIYFIGTIVLFVSSILPIYILLKKNPKKILL